MAAARDYVPARHEASTYMSMVVHVVRNSGEITTRSSSVLQVNEAFLATKMAGGSNGYHINI